jgi:hypothetical protein
MLTRSPSAQLQRHRRWPEPSSCLYRRSRDPETPLEVTNLPHPLFLFSPLSVAHNCSLERGSAAAEPSCHGSPPSGASTLVPCPPPCSPHLPWLSLSPSRRLRTPGVPVSAPSSLVELHHRHGWCRRWRLGRADQGWSSDLRRLSWIRRLRFKQTRPNPNHPLGIRPPRFPLNRAPAVEPDLSASLARGHCPVWPTCQPRALTSQSNLGIWSEIQRPRELDTPSFGILLKTTRFPENRTRSPGFLRLGPWFLA